MSNQEIRNALEDLRAIESIIEDMQQQATAIKTGIKAELGNRETDSIDLGNGIVVRNIKVLSNRFDTSTFKKLNNDLYTAYLKQITSYKFSYSL